LHSFVPQAPTVLLDHLARQHVQLVPTVHLKDLLSRLNAKAVKKVTTADQSALHSQVLPVVLDTTVPEAARPLSLAMVQLVMSAPVEAIALLAA
jgi:hypothetical protein